ncbi:Hypothetical protein LUCI_1239 [Lucifera butyrica]|uniref:PRC-barrel domain-containing protein n=1 Tax=Lucifera butyrica TaxID=1351585 RepID=A0A498RA49_9FIRM|nr:PRC-barrel domain-containing protein [Lucifera butyrica]VBB06028.1 Hypothetical protein LUCI_1239 [Lucifera butyrica]
MQKVSNVFGLPVLETETGTQIGEVREVVLNFHHAAVWGLIIAGMDWLIEKEQGIAFFDLLSIGRDAVMIRNYECLQIMTDVCQQEPSLHLVHDLLGKPIFTERGRELGILTDIVFEEVTGELKAYEVSDSLLTDLLYGRQMMPLPPAHVIGQDKMIVPECMKELLYTNPLSQ